MLKILMLSLCVVVLSACSKKDDNKGGGSKDGGQVQTQNKTDYSMCGNQLARSNPTGSWQMQLQSGEVTMFVKLEITDHQLRASNTCFLGDLKAVAQGTSTSWFDTQKITTTQDIEATQQSRDTENELNCSISLPAMSLNYSFDGGCLVLASPGEEPKKLVPARF